MQTKIKSKSWGIASRIGDTIYINKALKNYPSLYKAILNHEKGHTNGFSIKDIGLDLINLHLKGKKLLYYKFILENPKSLAEFSPIWVYNSHLAINPLLLALYGLFMAILGIGLLW